MKTNELISDDKKIAEIEMEAFKSSLRRARLLPDGVKVFGFVICWTGDLEKGIAN
ncbi:hypothetical protein [Cyclobacterium jeungdonense]|uniref:Uncharacterized protein n=1 Tax=Cyclobacterium jeungdonense TaxID=708087 RepID=A0ABT8C1Q8_9BACT|nr:hypothetical protein [Cyclobacterium jeungdonense]MDN3686286.1 hypothetical protein [Cyclobacterium jeungdonense]